MLRLSGPGGGPQLLIPAPAAVDSQILCEQRGKSLRAGPIATAAEAFPTIGAVSSPADAISPSTTAAPRVAIVVSRYNTLITDALRAGAERAYAARGGDAGSLVIAEAPGAYELVAVALAAASRADVAGVVALGCIIQGETIHDEVLAHAVAKGLTDITLKTGKPVAFGVLTTRNAEQARARAGLAVGSSVGLEGGGGGKGEEAMHALLDAIAAIDHLRRGEGRVSFGERPIRDKTRGADEVNR